MQGVLLPQDLLAQTPFKVSKGADLQLQALITLKLSSMIRQHPNRLLNKLPEYWSCPYSPGTVNPPVILDVLPLVIQNLSNQKQYSPSLVPGSSLQ